MTVAPMDGFGQCLAVLPEIVTGPAPRNLRGAVLMLGNFDGLHLGHQSLLSAARSLGHPIGIMSCEPHPRSFFAPDAPSFRLACAQRKLADFARAGIDYVYQPRFNAAFAGLSPRAFAEGILLDHLGVSAIVCGDDFRFGARRAGDVDWLRQWGQSQGIAVRAINEVTRQDERVSSSRVRAAVRAGELQTAARLLGRPWMVDVQLGRGDGTETLLRWPADVIRPAPGLYPVAIAGRSAKLDLRGATPLLIHSGIAQTQGRATLTFTDAT